MMVLTLPVHFCFTTVLLLHTSTVLCIYQYCDHTQAKKNQENTMPVTIIERRVLLKFSTKLSVCGW